VRSTQGQTDSPFPSVACWGLLVVLGGSGGCKLAAPPDTTRKTLPTIVDVVQSGSVLSEPSTYGGGPGEVLPTRSNV
jgi:hypothetical protein